MRCRESEASQEGLFLFLRGPLAKVLDELVSKCSRRIKILRELCSAVDEAFPLHPVAVTLEGGKGHVVVKLWLIAVMVTSAGEKGEILLEAAGEGG